MQTEVKEDNKVLIDNQHIGELKGLKFHIEYTANTLDTDIKSIKKAARSGIKEELIKRVDKIINDKKIELENDNKIYWLNNSIGKVKKGTNYLSPEIDIIADDALPIETKNKLLLFLNKWLSDHINNELGDLINLTKIKIEDQYLRGLVFQIYENNGVIKRNKIENIIKLISKENRKRLWGMGVKIGRYHVFLQKC